LFCDIQQGFCNAVMNDNFDYPEDRVFFEDLLFGICDSEDAFLRLFDFRSADVKRKEFNRLRNNLFIKLAENSKSRCCIQFPDICDSNSNLVIDHIIPLASNHLNKTLRMIRPTSSNKVPSQSFGSNHLENLILACEKCNSHKKHRILTKEQLKEIFNRQKS
jgi:5-methylcytosine-specific restriction endonuclease McrA